MKGSPNGFLLLLLASVPGVAGKEDGDALTTPVTSRADYGEQRASVVARMSAAAAAASHASCKLLTTVNRISRLHQLSRPHAGRRRRRWLLAVELRAPAAGWAPRRRTAAAVAQLEHVASDGQHEEFCAREHNAEHGSGTAGAQMAQGGLSAPSAAVLLASGASRFAALCKSDAKAF